jgi:hypothetical protein
MSRHAPTALRISAIVLKHLTILNLICGVVFLLCLAGTFLAPEPIMAELAERPYASDPAGMLFGLRLILVLTLGAVVAANVILTRLRAMVGTVRSGDPFVVANAARLKTIAWALLGLQFLDLAFGAISLTYFEQMDEFGWTPSLTGWLCVLMLFVLAGVFAQGARMREELEGTV